MSSIANVTVGQPVTASKTNEVINVLNALMNRVIITSSTTWSVPANVNKFKVTLCGKGGDGGTGRDDGNGAGPTYGGTSPMVTKIFTGIDQGTSIPITINSSLTSFGTYMQSTCGTDGTSNNSGGNGSSGTATGYDLMIGNISICVSLGMGYGEGGAGDGSSGGPAICVIEW